MQHFPVGSGLAGLLTGQLERQLEVMVRDADLLHVHGLWNTFLPAASRIARRRKIPLIVSPMGMAAPRALRQSPWKKRTFTLLFQRRALRSVGCLHAASEREKADLLEAFPDLPVAVVPHGVAQSSRDPASSGMAAQSSQGRMILFLGRLSPIKNLAALLRAWVRIEQVAPDAELRIVGPDEYPCADELRKLRTELGLARVSFQSCVSEQERVALLRQATALVLPSLSESFGMSAAEALAIGRPVVVSEATPWAHLVDEAGAGWATGVTPSDLAEALERALNTQPDTLEVMGLAARQLIASLGLTWERSAAETASLYRWLLGDEPRPPFVFESAALAQASSRVDIRSGRSE